MTIQEEKRHQKYIILFPIANLGYQLKIQVARGNFKWSTGYRATVNTYSVDTRKNGCNLKNIGYVDLTFYVHILGGICTYVWKI